jgi:glycosyltransferase involved in cell wall biosynthesis
MTHPKVTVLMPVFNGQAYLRQAIQSVLDQTFSDFEFLIVDDGSTDDSVRIINSFSDVRIRLVRNERNIRIVQTLNRGLSLAQGDYIARMDCDDLSLPKRLATQVAFMDTHPEVGICGTWIRTFNGRKRHEIRYPSEPDLVRCALLFVAPFAHPSVMMRRDSIEEHRLRYEEGYPNAEDFRFWQKASHFFPLSNVTEVLLLYRTKPTIGEDYVRRSEQTLRKIYRETLSFLDIVPTSLEIETHRLLASSRSLGDRQAVAAAEKWLVRIKEANAKSLWRPRRPFESMVGQTWFKACYSTANLGVWVWNRFWQSPLSRLVHPNPVQKIKFFSKCLLRR